MNGVTTSPQTVPAPADAHLWVLDLTDGSTTLDVAELIKLDYELPCRVNDPELWFADKPAELEQAKRLCAECPVRRACLAGALSRSEPWGVWGGEIFERGAVIPRKRPRGRPRKNDIAA